MTGSAAVRRRPGGELCDTWHLEAHPIESSGMQFADMSGLFCDLVQSQVMLLCGADLVESFATPGVWKREHLQQIMGLEHGVVCIAR